MKRAHLTIFAVVLLLSTFSIYGIGLSFHGKLEGIYLLKGVGRELFELKNHLRLVEYERLIAKVEFEAFYDRWRSKETAKACTPHLKYNWSKKSGTGYLISFFPYGNRFLTCLGHFSDADNNTVKGLFIGGGLPSEHYENTALKTPETGAAYSDRSGWHHLWGNIDETISIAAATEPIRSGQWEFIGSDVLFSSQYRLVLKSNHLTMLGQQPLMIERYLNYHAKDHFLTLITRFTNPGNSPLTYNYTFGDTPWSRYHATLGSQADLSHHYFVGVSGYQYSQPDKPATPYPGMANFLSWEGGALPSRGYITSKTVFSLSEKGNNPLPDNKSRCIILQWDSLTLSPGQSKIIELTIGLQEKNEQSFAPDNPAVKIDPMELQYLLSR